MPLSVPAGDANGLARLLEVLRLLGCLSWVLGQSCLVRRRAIRQALCFATCAASRGSARCLLVMVLVILSITRPLALPRLLVLRGRLVVAAPRVVVAHVPVQWSPELPAVVARVALLSAGACVSVGAAHVKSRMVWSFGTTEPSLHPEVPRALLLALAHSLLVASRLTLHALARRMLTAPPSIVLARSLSSKLVCIRAHSGWGASIALRSEPRRGLSVLLVRLLVLEAASAAIWTTCCFAVLRGHAARS